MARGNAGRKRGREAADEEAVVDNPGAAPGSNDAAANIGEPAVQDVQRREGAPDRRADMADIARRRAAHFANFAEEGAEEEQAQGNVHVGSNNARTLGPWSSAVELVNAREAAAERRKDKMLEAARQLGASEESPQATVSWQPSRDVKLGPRDAGANVRPLFDHCLDLLTEYVDCVESLYGVPDAIKVRLAAHVCKKRRMTAEAALLFASHAPSDVVLPDCSQVDQPAMLQLLGECAGERLERLELGYCGRGFGDAAAAALAQQGPLTSLASLLLGGAYRLTDEGLQKALSAAPNLTELSLPSASRITSASISKLPALAPKLRRLCLQDCRGLSAETLSSSLPQLMALQSLVLDGIPEVDDSVVMAVARIPCLKELSINFCPKVSDSGISALAASRHELEALRMDDCSKVTDAALVALAGGCKLLKTLSVRRVPKVTDAGLAAVAARGSLQHLVANGVGACGTQTMAAVAMHCKESLETLDVSFCRQVPDQALGLVADKCGKLRKLLLFGCSQITPTFVHGHSNDALVEVMGLGSACS